jgi:hypothetical protein
LGVEMKKTLNVLEEISKLDLGASRIDIGYLTLIHELKNNEKKTLEEILKIELESVLGDNKKKLIEKPQHIILYGFGRKIIIIFFRYWKAFSKNIDSTNLLINRKKLEVE